jgi:hypothetical protein
MLASLQTKLKRLSPQQKTQIEGHRQRWAKLRASSAPADRNEAELGIAEAYQAAGWPPPKEVVWCLGPIQMAALWAEASLDEIGPNLRAAIVEQVRGRAAFAIQRRVSASLLAAIDEMNPASETAGDTIRELVYRASLALQPTATYRQRWLLWLNRSRARMQLRDAACSPRGYAWLERHDLFRDVCGLSSETGGLRGLLRLAWAADWIIPHKHICWASEPPASVCTDAQGRLHSAQGAALEYHDGWTAYAWKGVEVPARVIDYPEQITHADIEFAPDIHIRRCMIERLTPERFVASGAAYRIAEDETGVLWERRWPDGDAWAAVEVINGTPEPDGSIKHYFLQVPPNMLTARSAVAWTYGLTARQYRGLLLRT